MTTLYAWLAAALLVCALSLGLVHSIRSNAEIRAERDVAVEQRQKLQDALKRSQALSAKLSKEKAATARAGASTRLSVEKSLDSQRAWADTPVPKEVQDALVE
jgi:hypothetical protein